MEPSGPENESILLVSEICKRVAIFYVFLWGKEHLLLLFNVVSEHSLKGTKSNMQLQNWKYASDWVRIHQASLFLWKLFIGCQHSLIWKEQK